MAAHYFGNEVKETKRYRLGKVLGGTARHFLLMTATPHAGKEEDFQLFMALLDSDRFEGKVRDGVHTADVSDLMRRMVKEQHPSLRRATLVPRAARLHRSLRAVRPGDGPLRPRSPTTSPRRWGEPSGLPPKEKADEGTASALR